MTTLFFSPLASDVDDPWLLGPGVEDDGCKPDMWRTRGGWELCYSLVNFGSVGESSVEKKKKKRGREEGEDERVMKGRVASEAGLNLRQQRAKTWRNGPR